MVRKLFIFVISISLGLLIAPTVLHAAFETTDGGWTWVTSGSGTNIEGTTWYLASERTSTLTSGIIVSIEVSGGGTGIAATDQLLSARGGANGMYMDSTIHTKTGAQVVTTDTGCTYGVMCANRGKFTISFSQPVTDPVLHLSGIGGGGFDSATNGKTTAWTEFELLTPGITMSLLGQQNLSIVGSNRIEPTTKNPTTNCSTTTNSYDATASAACGSIQLIGTFNLVEFQADLGSVNNANPYVDGQLEDAFIMAISVDPALTTTTTTLPTTTTALPTTTTSIPVTSTSDTPNSTISTSTTPTTSSSTGELPPTGSSGRLWGLILLAMGIGCVFALTRRRAQ